MTNDIINGMFEFGMACTLFKSVIKLYHDKCFKGWSIYAVLWPTLWGLWNLFYYPSLHQIYSFYGGLCVVLVNMTWIILAVYYSRNNFADQVED